MKRNLIWILLGVMVLGLVALSMRPQPVLVDLGEVTVGPMRVTIDEEGRTRVKERYIVSAPVAGNLHRITLDPGDAVAAGQTMLAVIDPSDPAMLDKRTYATALAQVKAAQAAKEQSQPLLERAQANVDYAEAEMRRISSLVASRTASQQDQQMIELRLRTARNELRAAEFSRQIAAFELEQAEAALVHASPASERSVGDVRYEIRSPVDGLVLAVVQRSAAVVAPGTPLVELGDPGQLEVEVDVLSQDAVRIASGAYCDLEQWGGGEPLRCQVRRVEPSAFTKISALGVEEQRVWVILDFVGEQDHPLGDGFRVEARIILWEAEEAIRLPTSALFRHEGEWAVYRVQEGRARRTPVTIGHRNPLDAEVLAGISPGDIVILHPSDQIEDGTLVERRSH